MSEATHRVWHVPQVPMDPFYVDVPDVPAAKLVLKTLADYDLFQFKHKFKPDYTNASGLEVSVNGEWEEWECMDGDIWDAIRASRR